MCAIAGYFDRGASPSPGREAALRTMLSVQRHRGPDGQGLYVEPGVGLAHARLALVGGPDGRQPLASEDGNVRVACAGEIFNHEELRRELEHKGHRFSTSSDCEVVAHLYEECGMDFLSRLNGQFAIALWDHRRRELFLARDRFGILPLFYAQDAAGTVFASEVKALLTWPGLTAEIDLKALDQIFTFWTPVTPRTPFKGISEVRPGYYVRVSDARTDVVCWWALDFPRPSEYEDLPQDRAAETLGSLLSDAVALRMKAAAPVGVYLSGGLDSGSVAWFARTAGPLRAFSIGFAEASYDETASQEAIASALGARTERLIWRGPEGAALFPELVWHAETPFLRTSPGPLYRLSELAREKGVKAVLTGEGADEFLLGYDIFKELKVRRFWARRPRSARRRLLLNRLYPYLPFIRSSDSRFLSNFFSNGLETEATDPFYSHALRWRQTAHLKRFYSERVREELEGYDPVEELAASLPPRYAEWDPMARAQTLESSFFMGRFLLSTQGDRMALAHGVEARYPFLDHRLVERVNRFSPKLKMHGLKEKMLLKKCMAGRLPEDAVRREKIPYRAPGLRAEWLKTGPAAEALSPDSVREAGCFDVELVKGLLSKWAKRGTALNEMDDMALNGILSTQLFHRLFMKDFDPAGAVWTQNR